jgi:hypothetical protein
MPTARSQPEYLHRVQVALSTERLSLGFRNSPAETDASVLARHLYNMALCAALYPTLHTLEIALRNSIDQVLQAVLPASTPGTVDTAGLPFAGCWLDALPGVLGTWEQVEVRKVKQRLVKERKGVTRHRLLAGLSFGFWTGLFTRRYEVSPHSSFTLGVGTRTALWPKHLKAVFPEIPRRLATRDHIYQQLRPIAELRNQVFHHRPVWRQQLNTLHVTAMEIIGWISPELQQVTSSIDRFASVHQMGDHGFEAGLIGFLNARA